MRCLLSAGSRYGVAYLITDASRLAWATVLILVIVAILGITMAARWIKVYRAATGARARGRAVGWRITSSAGARVSSHQLPLRDSRPVTGHHRRSGSRRSCGGTRKTHDASGRARGPGRELPDAVLGLPYQGHLATSHNAGGTLSVVAGALPPGLTLPTAFGPSGEIIGGTATQQGIEPTYSFTVQGTGDQGQPLYQAYQITVDQNLPLTIVLPASGSTLEPGTVGQAFGQNFFLSGGAGPYSWAVASGQLPPGLSLQTFAGPTDANNELAGTPTTAGTFTFIMRLIDYSGQQATQRFSLTIDP